MHSRLAGSLRGRTRTHATPDPSPSSVLNCASRKHPIPDKKRTSIVANDPQPPNIAHSRRINIDAPEELACWSKALGISSYHLRKIITRVGPMVSDVYYALGLREWDFPKPPIDSSR
jgi:hypothetical protein